MRIARVALLLLVACLALAAAAAAQAPDAEKVFVRVLADAEVYGERYTLGEIAEMDGFDMALMRELADLEIGRSPLPGRSLRLSESSLRAHLRRADHAERVALRVPEGARVTRAALTVSGERIAEMVLDFAAAESGVSAEDLQQDVRGEVDDAVLPRGDPEWQISALGRNASPSGERTYVVVARIDGEDVWRTTVRLHQKVYRDVVLAARTIRRNAVIQSEDVRIERRPMRGSRSDTLPSTLAEVVGRQARRAIGANEPIRAEMLDMPNAVQEGGRVQVVYRTDRVRLRVMGVALVNGRVGDFIPVKNLQSGKVIYGVIEAPEMVRVN